MATWETDAILDSWRKLNARIDEAYEKGRSDATTRSRREIILGVVGMTTGVLVTIAILTLPIF